MSGFRISNAAYQDDTLIDVAKVCSNTTVGPNKYQLFCATISDLDGSCVKLPSRLTAAGELDCVEVTTQAYLQNLYDTTGMACAINCYYPISVNIPTFNIPTFSLPSYSFVYPTRTYEYPSATYSPPTLPTPPANIPNIPGIGVEGGASVMDPNFLFTFMAVFAVMLLCVRRAI